MVDPGQRMEFLHFQLISQPFSPVKQWYSLSLEGGNGAEDPQDGRRKSWQRCGDYFVSLEDSMRAGSIIVICIRYLERSI